MQWRLRQRFSPSRYLRRSDGLQRLSEGGSASDWILARELCAYTTLDGAGVPPGKRRGYASMAIRRWSPFADPQFHVEWVGQRAMVWAWSAERILDFDSVGRITAPRRMLPETLYRGAPMVDGDALLAMDHGVEGRIWREQRLVACHWWPLAPDLGEWNMFRRGAGLSPQAAVPVVAGSELADAPWSGQRAVGLGGVATQHRSLLQAVAVGAAVLMLVAPFVACLHLLAATAGIDHRIASQDQSLQQILDARESAERDADAVTRLLALRPPESQVNLLAYVSVLIPGTWQLLEWRVPDPGTVEMVARMTNPDPQAIVQAFESSGRFTDVTAELGRKPDELTIKAKVLRVQPVAAPASATPARTVAPTRAGA